jgi:hypothetical protein
MTAVDDDVVVSAEAGTVGGEMEEEEEEDDESSIEGDDYMEYEKDATIRDTSIGGVEDTKRIERDGATIRIVDVDDGDADIAISSKTYDDVDVRRRDDDSDPSPRVDTPSSSSATGAGATATNNNNNRDANRQFVDGLDEIDKLFESVEVPDELDVGADGSSMQDVLVGQGIKIAWKHARNIGRGIKRRFDGIKSALDDGVGRMLPSSSSGLLSSGDANGAEDEGGNISLVSLLSGLTGTGRSMDDDRDYATLSSEEGAGDGSGGGEENQGNLRSKRKNERGGGSNKLLKSFPLIKSHGVKRIWKFAKRKLEQARHLLDDFLGIFEGADDDDGYDFGLMGNILGDDNIRLGGNSATGTRYETSSEGGGEGPNGRIGSEVDESFLKSRYEAMMKTATNDE